MQKKRGVTVPGQSGCDRRADWIALDREDASRRAVRHDQAQHRDAEAFGNVGDPHVLYGSRLPLGRIATEDEIGRVALFLASDLAAVVTGSVVAADAGDLAV